MEKLKEAKLRKHNMRLYSVYTIVGFDLLFYYGIKVLYLSQVKHISDANIVFLSTIFALASIASVIIATAINNRTSNRKTLIIGDTFNIASVFLLIVGNDFTQIACAEILNAIAFAMKNISSGPMLEESIPKTDRKDTIFMRIDEKAYFRYCTISAISTVIAGYLYNVNPYIPMYLCLLFTVISLIVAINFEEVNKSPKNKDANMIKSIKDLKEGFIYTIKSKRIRALLLSIGFLWGIFSLFTTYQTTLLKNMNVSAQYIGIIAMFLELVRGYGGRWANQYNETYKNKTLTNISTVVAVAFIVAGIGSALNMNFAMQLVVVILAFTAISALRGIYMVIYKKYVNNFSNVKILPTIYSMTNLYWNLSRIVITSIGSLVLTIVDIRYGIIVMGILFVILAFVIYTYMKTRVGLDPEEYSKEDLKYSNDLTKGKGEEK